MRTTVGTLATTGSELELPKYGCKIFSMSLILRRRQKVLQTLQSNKRSTAKNPTHALNMASLALKPPGGASDGALDVAKLVAKGLGHDQAADAAKHAARDCVEVGVEVRLAQEGHEVRPGA